MNSYMGAPKPLGTEDPLRSESNGKGKYFAVMTLVIVIMVAYMALTGKISMPTPPARKNGSTVQVYSADINGKEVTNYNLIPEQDIARLSEDKIYIRRDALAADESSIYIPQWRVRILRPGIIDFAYAFDGNKLYLYGLADVDVTNASGEFAFGSIDTTYVGYVTTATGEKIKDKYSVFDIDDKRFLRYFSNPKLENAVGNAAYMYLRDNTLQEFKAHFGDFRSYLNIN